MKEKKVWAVYFSPTGTTEKTVSCIAEEISKALGLEYRRYDFTVPQARKDALTFGEDDLVVFGTPVYAGRVPNVLLKYLDTLQGGGATAVPVVSYGNRNYDEALKELRNIMEDHGFHTVAAGAFIGEHSFSTILGKGRPDEADLAVEKAFAGKISDKLKEGKDTTPIQLKDESPVKPYYTPRLHDGTPIDIRKVKPKTNEKCKKCGICAKVCSMGAIDPEDVNQFINICIKCGACVKKCPHGARYYDDANYLYHKTDLEETYKRRAEPEFFV